MDRSYQHLGADPLTTACRDAIAGRRASEQLRRWAKPHGLSDLQLRLLHLLARNESLDQSALAAGLWASPARVSGVVLELRAAGMIAPLADQRDRRRQLWRLTVAGRRCIATVAATAWADDGDGGSAASSRQEDAA